MQVSEITAPPAAKDYLANQTQVQTSIKQRVDYELFEALKEKADVQDNRAKFY